ncbi:WD domain, G-beta repeat [Streptomyces sp. ADI97-07]|uniref:caspase, EACC1-associated type n=1 Tax=Streptomyces sp. ADI97-07 TaxID=1522762 RepID=UPI000F55608F|nr:caspase family protein [Streptomyces sp. ADI97-07]RPK85496.1 WD domain, G-beta repeat [Streptomyces sp. ADI97-07]
MTGGGLAVPGARAVLFGTASHVRESDLPDLPSVGTTLDDLQRTLLDVCGMAPGHVERVPADADAAQVLDAVEVAVRTGGGPVLFYYVGHGQLGPRDALYLATRASRSFRQVAQSVSYRTISDVLGDAGSGSLVVLDCCFSGRGGAPASDGGVRRAFASARPRGSFLLTSASHYALSFAPEDERRTLFTGRLLELLNDGDPAGPPWLTADRLHVALDERFAEDPRVDPARQSEGALGSLRLARNRAYRKQPDGTVAAEQPADVPCPYPGLEPYRAVDSAHFFGRDGLTARLLELVDELPDGGQLMLVGASGAGKSSLLRAGLVAGLEARTDARGSTLLLPAPGPHPMRALAEAWARATGRDSDEVRAEFEHGCFPAPRHGLPDCALLVVDQFEEIFTQCDTIEECAAFVSLLTRDGPGRRPRVVLGLRADHYGSCLEHPGLERVLARAQLAVPPLREQELRAAIEGPAAAVGMTIEQGLTDRLLDDLRSGRSARDAATGLPFLAHALRETWRSRSGVRLTLAGYQATEGIWQSVATTTRRVYESLDDDGQATMRELLLRLVHLPPDGGPAVLRHSVPLASLPDRSGQIRDQLATARLLTVDKNSVQIAHEALLRAWPLLHQWVQENAATLLLRQQVGTAAEEWDTAGRDAAFLFRGSRLQTAEELAEHIELHALEHEFLAAGQSHATSELRREQRRTMLLKRALSAVAIALCLALVAAVVAVRERGHAQAQQEVATARALLAEADILDTSDPDAALRLQLAANVLRPSAEAHRALFDTLADSAFRGVSELPVAPADMALARGGRMLATSERDRLAVWDTSRDPVPRTPLVRMACPSNNEAHTPVTFGGPGERMLVAVCGDEVRLWNLADRRGNGKPRPVATLRATGLKDVAHGPSAVVLSPDGNTVAAIGWSRYVGHSKLVLWDVRDPRKPRQLGLVEDSSTTQELVQGDRAAFSPDGRLLVTADTHGELRLWDVSDPGKPKPQGVVEDAGGALAFSPDGDLLAASDDRAVKLIDIRSPRSPKVLDEQAAHTDMVSFLDFSPDGRRLASSSWDETVAVWDVRDPRDMTRESRLYRHSSFAHAARFGADGDSLVSVSYDEVIHWDLTDVRPPRVLDVLPNGALLALARDGTTLAVARGDRIDLWNLADPAEPRRLAKLSNPVKERFDTVDGGSVIGVGDVLADIEFSHDGTLLATINHDRRVTLWDVSAPAHPRVTGTVRSGDDGAPGPSLAFAPGRRLLAVNDLKHVQVWDVSDPARPASIASLAARGDDVIFSPNGRQLLIAGTSLRLWDLRSGKTAPLSGDRFYQGSSVVAFSPRGNVVAAVAEVPAQADTGIQLWAAERAGSVHLLGELQPSALNGRKFTRLAFHPDGVLLAGAEEDGAVRVWSVTDPGRPHLAFTFSGHSEGVDDVVLGGPQGRTMITTSAGYAHVVDIGDYPEIAADSIRIACRATDGGLSREEWEEHVPEVEFRDSCPYPADEGDA